MFEPDRVRSLWELMQYRAEVSPRAPMFFDESTGGSGRAVPFGEVRDRALRLAAGFHGAGVGAGTRVLWQLPSWPLTVEVSLALARLGAVQIPVLHLHREREVGYALRESAAEYAVVPGEWRGHDYAGTLRKVADGGVRVLSVADGLPEAAPEGVLPEFVRPGSTPTWIYYTSGTTAEPKGVEHTDGSLVAGGIGLATALGMTEADTGSIAFPYAHIAGPDYVIAMLLSGFPAVVLDTFEPAAAVEAYRRHGVTMAGGSTAFYQAFLDESRRRRGSAGSGPESESGPGTGPGPGPGPGKLIPTLRLLSGGGAPLPPGLCRAAGRELGCAVVHGYGMTECPMIAMGTPYDSDEQLAHTVGKPVTGARIRIARPDGTEAGPGEAGEVTVRGPMVCRGYTDPALTAAAFDADGYFRTGDLGLLRADGHLVLTGRLKDIVIRKGENISAPEIEELIRGHPAVGDVAVIGLPDRERGERVCAVVSLKGGEALTLGALTAHLRGAGLMPQKLPEQLEVLDALPRGGPLDKVLKGVLRERFG
ncbi:cyclohexanecarboxylate-CoA ligase [Streptomyces sp. CB02923]|uniref:class I adenylate-forming enzyme family protein n=1 Tax=Streptomyces sp. CB02923 TaxID=1718985 RepID=UPI00093D23EF|nr:AMP-binding protein [Streptomyces sp. CB02923]OKI03485.1 cyclohexanecarboxylate-CoA ligase [Streptomyces sp. CB02923]